jgi:hypothetical protein
MKIESLLSQELNCDPLQIATYENEIVVKATNSYDAATIWKRRFNFDCLHNKQLTVLVGSRRYSSGWVNADRPLPVSRVICR